MKIDTLTQTIDEHKWTANILGFIAYEYGLATRRHHAEQTPQTITGFADCKNCSNLTRVLPI